MKASILMSSDLFIDGKTQSLLNELNLPFTEESRKRQVYNRIRHSTVEIENHYLCMDFTSLEDLLEFKKKVDYDIIIKDSDEFDFEIEIYDTYRE